MKSLLRLERHLFARRYGKAIDALVEVLDEAPTDGVLATRAIAAVSAIASAPGVALRPRQRIALLERRAPIRAVFEASAYGSGVHLMRQIGAKADGSFCFDHPEHIDKYVVFCPTADLEPNVVAAIGHLPPEEATPLLLSMLTDPPADRGETWWIRVAALAMRLSGVTFGAELFLLATRAWNVEPDFVTPAIRRSLLAMGCAECERSSFAEGRPHLVVAHEHVRERLKPHLPTLEARFRVTVLDQPRAPDLAFADVAALAPDVLWLPEPGAAVWTCALASMRCAPIQLAADHDPSPRDFDDAMAFLLSAMEREAA